MKFRNFILILIASVLIFATSCGNGGSPAANTTKTPTPPAYKLELISWELYREAGWIIVEGEVKNISNETLEDVLATVDFYTEDEIYITTATALIDYNIIIPSWTSYFTVIQEDNSLIRSASIDFKYASGEVIPTKRSD